MRALVRREMEAGALGIGSSLIYAPAIFASTEELVELCKAAAPYQGKYISHMRSEGDRLLEAVDELIRIAREARVPAEIYHLKAGGRGQLAEDGRGHREGRGGAARGLEDHRRHVHLHRGGHGVRRLPAPLGARRRARCRLRAPQDPEQRARIVAEIKAPGQGWENLCALAAIARADAPARVQERRLEAPRGQDPGPGRGAARAGTGRRPSSTSCSKTGRAWAWRSSSCPRRTCASRSACPGSPSAPTRRPWPRRACS